MYNFIQLYTKMCYNDSMKEIKYSSKKRTHDRIKKAFAVLLSEKKALNKITVAELSKRAEVTRGTFYAHYDNIFEVAEELENEFIAALDDSTSNIEHAEDFPKHLHQIFVFLAANEELYRQLLLSDAPLVFVTKLNVQIDKIIHRLVKQHAITKPMLELDITFLTDGATFMILKYFRGDLDMTLDEIESYLRQRIEEMFLDTSK